MARRPRLLYRDAVYHVMSRGNRKADIFGDDLDRRHLVEVLAAAARRYHLRVYAACLMRNHYHLVLDTPFGNLSDGMRFINGEYSQSWNRRYTQTGHLFEARFHSVVIQRESYLRFACRYVVLNPVRAGMVNAPAGWPWSTYRATAGLEVPPRWLHVGWLESAFNASTREDAQRRYRVYVAQRIAARRRLSLKSPVLGRAAFQRAVVDAGCAKHPDRELRPTEQASVRPSLETLFDEAPTRGVLRDDSIERAHVTHRYTLSEIARHLGVHRTTVSRALRRADRCRMRDERDATLCNSTDTTAADS